MSSSDISVVASKVLRREGKPKPDAVGRVRLHTQDFYGQTEPKTINVDLYNYGIDGNVPRKEHKQWIRQQLVPFVREYRYHVKIHGRASGAGPSWANKRVSRERVILLKEFLSKECGLRESQVPGNDLREQSNHFANSRDKDNQLDRSVRIVLSPGWKTRPDPIAKMKVRIGQPEGQLPEVDLEDFLPQQPPQDKVSMPYDKPRPKYQIRYLGGGGAAFFVGFAYHKFEIKDHQGNRKRFRLKAGNIDIGVQYTPEMGKRKWSTFTSNAQQLSDFDGRWASMERQALSFSARQDYKYWAQMEWSWIQVSALAQAECLLTAAPGLWKPTSPLARSYRA